MAGASGPGAGRLGNLDEPLPLTDDLVHLPNASLISGNVQVIQRRHGRKAGFFDVMTFAMEILDASGQVVATNSQSFILMRGGSGDR